MIQSYYRPLKVGLDLNHPMKNVDPGDQPRAANVVQNGGWGDLRDVLMCRAINQNALKPDLSFLPLLEQSV